MEAARQTRSAALAPPSARSQPLCYGATDGPCPHEHGIGRLVGVSLTRLLKVLWFQRRVVLPAAIVSLCVMAVVFLLAGPTYRTSAAVVLLNPPTLPEVTPENPTVPAEFQNPYARFGDLSVIVDIIVRVFESDPVVERLKASGLDGTFEIAANRDFYRGPIIDVSAEAPSGQQAILNATLVLDEMKRQLVDLQEQQGTDQSYFIKPELVVAPDKATTVLSGTLRTLILIGGLGAMVTVGSGIFADSRQRRRRKAVDTGDDETFEQLA